MAGKNKMLLMIGIATFSFLIIVLMIIGIASNRKKSVIAPSPTPLETVGQTGITQTPVVGTRVPTPSGKPHPTSELQFEQETKLLYDQNPWLLMLPLHTTTYFVYFDPNKKLLVAKIYTTTDKQQDVQIEIVTKLRTLGVPLEKYPISYVINNTGGQ